MAGQVVYEAHPAMFRAHPWLGVGWGEFGWAQFTQLPQVGVKVEMSLHAHNAVLDLLAKTGVKGIRDPRLMLVLAQTWRAHPETLHATRARDRAAMAVASAIGRAARIQVP